MNLKAENILAVAIVQMGRHFSKFQDVRVLDSGDKPPPLPRAKLWSGHNAIPQHQKLTQNHLPITPVHNLTPFRSAGHYLAQQRKCKLSFAASTLVPVCYLIRVTDFRLHARSFRKNTALPLPPITSNGK